MQVVPVARAGLAVVAADCCRGRRLLQQGDESGDRARGSSHGCISAMRNRHDIPQAHSCAASCCGLKCQHSTGTHVDMHMRGFIHACALLICCCCCRHLPQLLNRRHKLSHAAAGDAHSTCCSSLFELGQLQGDVGGCASVPFHAKQRACRGRLRLRARKRGEERGQWRQTCSAHVVDRSLGVSITRGPCSCAASVTRHAPLPAAHSPPAPPRSCPTCPPSSSFRP